MATEETTGPERVSENRVLMVGSTPPVYLSPDVAVVGSSHTLMGRDFGEQIDQHAEVIRFNFARTKGYEKDVGSRETIRLWAINDKALKRLYPNQGKRMSDDITETTLNVPTLISYMHMEGIRKNGEFYGRKDNVHGLHIQVEKFKKRYGLTLDKPARTGLNMLIALIDSGIKPHVYGFGTGTKDVKHPAHYFRKGVVVPTNGYHDVIQEEKILLKLAEDGLIILHECEVGVSKHLRKSKMKNRKEMATGLIKEGDVVAELGVDWGSFSNFILGNTKCGKLYSIDRWAGDRGHDDKQYEGAKNLLGKHGDRSEVIKATFEEALPRFEDESLDFIYIDGYAHTGQEGGKTLRDWWHKVKPGGIMSGHDYSDKWPKTKMAVDAFAESSGLSLHVTADGKEYESWWFVKPGGWFKHEKADVETEDIGEGTKIWANAHVCKGAKIGKNCVIGEGVYIGPDVVIGDRCKIQNLSLIYRGLTIGNDVFIGPNVVTTNDIRPRAYGDWSDRFRETVIEDKVAIGAGCVILCGITLGEGSEIGCGSAVTRTTKPWHLYFGSPATEQGESPDKP